MGPQIPTRRANVSLNTDSYLLLYRRIDSEAKLSLFSSANFHRELAVEILVELLEHLPLAGAHYFVQEAVVFYR